MMDLHMHIMPGVDDKAKDLGFPMKILKPAYDYGITTVCDTPHKGGVCPHLLVFYQRRRIVFIGQKGIAATYGGVENFTEKVGVKLAERGHRVTVYYLPYYSSSPQNHRRVNLKKIKSIATKHLDALSHETLRPINSLSERFDIIVYQSQDPPLSVLSPSSGGVLE